MEFMKETFPKPLRIRRSGEIKQLLIKGQKYTGNHIILYCSVSEASSQQTRAAILSPKRVGNAVKRNRIRRRLREVFRKHQRELIGSTQLIMMGRTSALDAPFDLLTKDFLNLCRKARLVADT